MKWGQIMRSILTIILFLSFSSGLFADGFFFGAEINALGIDEKSYIGNNTREIVKNLNGKMSDESVGALAIGFYEGYQVNEYFAVIARQRYFSVRGSADFYTQNSMNFEISKNVVPLNAGVRLRLKLDEVFGLFAEILSGIYIIDSFENGFFGTYHKRDMSFGAGLGFGGDFIIREKVNIAIGLTYEWFSVAQSNLILEDGGDGGGIGLVLMMGLVF